SPIALQRQSGLVLHLFERDARADLRDEGPTKNLRFQERLIVLRIARHHFDDIVGIAGHRIAFERLGAGSHRLLELRSAVFGVSLQRHMRKDQEIEAELFSIESYDVTANDPCLLHGLYPS